MSLTFDILREADIPSLIEAFKGYVQISSERMMMFLSEKQNVALIAKLEGKIIGLIYGYALTRFDGKAPQFFIYSVDIQPDYQNKGYGSCFVKYAVDWARDNGFYKSFVPTEKDNPRACRVYEKAGMKYNENNNDRMYVIEYDA